MVTTINWIFEDTMFPYIVCRSVAHTVKIYFRKFLPHIYVLNKHNGKKKKSSNAAYVTKKMSTDRLYGWVKDKHFPFRLCI